uniref:MULE transposase domain-containing protein n=1 Tax=Lactuca sativa TaxID=4236 RepID=A0A9R1WAS3_LACSA|nr:hypothetical protein LSAT_V11C300142140 [Lactuca sativa]
MTYRVHDPDIHWKQMKPVVGECDESPCQLRFALTNYAVANGYQLWVMKSDRHRVIARCGKIYKKDRCPFRVYVAWKYNERTFQIKSICNIHLCARNFNFGTLVSCNWLAKHYLKDIIMKPKMTLTEMKEDVLRMFSVNVSKGQCHRARTKAREMIEGKLEEHYAKVWDYAAEILRSNPGSTCKVGVDSNASGMNYFKRFYVCLKAFKDGWNRGCRRVLGLDGCFLKGQIKGELLTAVGRDADNHVYPIAWAMIDVDNKDNWTCFIELLVADLDLDCSRGLVVISDQHKRMKMMARRGGKIKYVGRIRATHGSISQNVAGADEVVLTCHEKLDHEDFENIKDLQASGYDHGEIVEAFNKRGIRCWLRV